MNYKRRKIGVIIVTFNSESIIENCLKSLLKSTHRSFLCVITDNLSSDKTVGIVQKRYPKIEILKNRRNGGFGEAVNKGVRFLQKKYHPDYYLVLNPDTIINTFLIQRLVHLLESDASIGLASPIITYAHDTEKIWYAGGYFNRLFCYTKHSYMNKKVGSFMMKLKLPPYSHPLPDGSTLKFQDTDFITGACMMIRASILPQTGLFPENYFLYWEDVAFSRKVVEYNYRLAVLYEPLVSHMVSSSTGKAGTNTMSPLKAYYFARNPFIYIKEDVKNPFLKFTNYLGQFFIRFPYYGLQMVKDRNLTSITAYIRGFLEGLT